MIINKTIMEKILKEFRLLRSEVNDAGEPFYKNHDKKLTETTFKTEITLPQSKALVRTIEELKAEERYPTLYNHCKEILNTFHKLKKYQTFNF